MVCELIFTTFSTLYILQIMVPNLTKISLFLNHRKANFKFKQLFLLNWAKQDTRLCSVTKSHISGAAEWCVLMSIILITTVQISRTWAVRWSLDSNHLKMIQHWSSPASGQNVSLHWDIWTDVIKFPLKVLIPFTSCICRYRKGKSSSELF